VTDGALGATVVADPGVVVVPDDGTVLVAGADVWVTGGVTGVAGVVSGAGVLAAAVAVCATGVSPPFVFCVAGAPGPLDGEAVEGGSPALAGLAADGGSPALAGEAVEGGSPALAGEDPDEGLPALAGEAADLADDATVFTVDSTVETTDWPELSGGDARVAARAWRENTSITMKIPAATTTSCTARIAMRRATGCDMSSSHPPETGSGTCARQRRA
jgi:hypothetical protein